MDKDFVIEEIRSYGDELHVGLWYPDNPDTEISKIVIALMDVRAADDIRISYDKDRDGWLIEQATVFEWPIDDKVGDAGWTETAFAPAWPFEKEGEGHG